VVKADMIMLGLQEARGWIRSLCDGAFGARPFGKTLRDLTHPLMGSNRTLGSFDACSQEALPLFIRLTGF